MSDTITLLIGNKNYSSWSLRPWLLLSHFQVLFGDFSIADAMYAPVVSRFHTYGVDPGEAGSYMQTMLNHPALQAWYADAAAEVEAVPSFEVGR